MTPIWVPGSKAARRRPGHTRGFTLIELMVVIAIVAISAGLVSLAIRDPAASQLDREGLRLAALLDSARATARASGQPVTWWPAASLNRRTDAPTPPKDSPVPDFLFAGLPARAALPSRWLDRAAIAVRVSRNGQVADDLVLGPEPLIPPQSVTLSLDGQQITLASDGLGPFRNAGNAGSAGSAGSGPGQP
ncbi:pilus assembly FimT family protein [Amphibiibacter pelophylacis]|uniref:Prepilin-type N-terminal cleavage/methylation domain-containing protein n=1 Tax=Amphibiibacter pelophylacis TaxID=1799477 RepID=A0ACC6P3T3_9BURK